MKARKLLSFILAAAMLFSFASVSIAAEGGAEPNTSVVLTDISPATVEGRAVTKLVSLGIINGYEDGTYRPSQNITRAEFCVVMTKFVGMDSVMYKDVATGFEDLDTDENYAWARPYVKMAVDRGIITGFEDATFRAKDPVTYEQAIKMIVCALRYDKLALEKTVEGDWSSGYMRQAQELRITLNAPTTDKKGYVSRGTVAVLLNNALDVEPLNEITGEQSGALSGATSWQEQLGRKEVRGIVTGTYVTELESGVSYVPKDHIQIGTDIYEVGFTQNPNDFLGCRVRATITSENDGGDYPVCENLEVLSSNLLTIDASCIEGYEPGMFKYVRSKTDTATRTANLDEDIITIYNGKYYDYDLTGIEDNLKVGNVELIDNDSDNSYDVARINSYDIYVVDSSSRTQTIKVKYGAGDDGTVTFPDSSTSLIFSLRMSNGEEMAVSSLKEWDVLNVRQTPEDVEGRRYYEAVVTRKTVSGKVTGRDESDKTYIEIDGKDYYMSEDFVNYEDDDKPSLEAGDNAQVYLDAEDRVVAAAEAKSSNSSENYAYLLGLRQDSDKSEYDLEFWIYTTNGEKLQIGSADRLTINGTRYKATDKDILDIFASSAEMANSAYASATGYVENVVYHQPIIYQKNSAGLISVIHTVLSEENDDISMVMDGGDNYVPCDKERSYRSSSRSFTEFKVSSATDIIFVPDDRGKTDDYLYYSSYSSAFVNSREYYVEAYGLSSKGGTASLVLLYHQNDSRIYTSSSNFMIVSGKSQTLKDGTNITGYGGKGGGTISTTETTVTVSEEDGPDISAIGKGDIIRYILNTDRELIDYEIWFDASDPVQNEPCSDISEALDKRILAIHSTSIEPREGDYPSATFRLQYGTVTELVLDEDDEDIDEVEETITVVPTIVEDNMEMVNDGDGVVTRTIGSSVRVFYFDRSARNGTVEKNAELSEILPYVDYGDSATRVVTYSTSGTLRMVYIIDG